MSEEPLTVGEIRADFGREQTRILHEYNDLVDRVAERGVDTVPNSEHMSYGVVEQLLLNEKLAEVNAAVTEYNAQLREAYDNYRERLEERTEEVRDKLFGGLDHAALARAAVASKEELAGLMELANFTGNKELGKVAFAVAMHKGHGWTYPGSVDTFPSRSVLFSQSNLLELSRA